MPRCCTNSLPICLECITAIQKVSRQNSAQQRLRQITKTCSTICANELARRTDTVLMCAEVDCVMKLWFELVGQHAGEASGFGFQLRDLACGKGPQDVESKLACSSTSKCHRARGLDEIKAQCKPGEKHGRD